MKCLPALLLERISEQAIERPRGEPGNGVTGDGRASTAELGKRVFEMKVDYAVRQIQALLAPPR